MTVGNYFSGWLDDSSCYEWGNLFASSWDRIVEGMGEKAAELGLRQEAGSRCLTWRDGAGKPQARFVFVDDPSDIAVVRRVFTDESHLAAATCFVIVRQPESGDTRGDVVFDIFKMTSASYLRHENRVYTPPHGGKGR